MAGSRDDGTFADDKAHHGGRKVGRDHVGVPYPKLYDALEKKFSTISALSDPSGFARYTVESLQAAKKNRAAGSPDPNIDTPSEWRGVIRGFLAPSSNTDVPEDAHLNDMWESRYEY